MSGYRWCSTWKPRLPLRHVEHRAARDVRRAEQLADVEAAARLVGDLLLAERVRLVGKWPQKMIA
jgi:hypothetical protein